MLVNILASLGAKLALGAAIVWGLLLVFLNIKKSGAQAQQAEDLKQEVKDVNTAQEIRNEIAIAPVGTATTKLRDEWTKP